MSKNFEFGKKTWGILKEGLTASLTGKCLSYNYLIVLLINQEPTVDFLRVPVQLF